MEVKIGKYPAHHWYHNFLYKTFGYSPKQKVKVKIDYWDTWSMDMTLAPIILPLLKQLKETKQGNAMVDDEDLPPELRHNNNTSNESMQYDMFAGEEHDEAVWETYSTRWDYIMDSMIFSFEKLCEDNWESELYSGKADIKWIDADNGYSEMVDGPSHTLKFDREGIAAMDKRIQYGLEMFGKYYRGLWD